MRQVSFIIFIILFDIFKLNSQNLDIWKNYTFSQRVFDIQVHDYYVWTATFGGLVKYNKKTGEKTYYNRANANLPDNNITSIAFDNNNNIWLGTMFYGIGKFNGEWCYNYYRSNSGLPSDQWNTKITTDNENNIWIGSMHFLARYKNGKWKTWEIGNPTSSSFMINDILVDENNRIWIATSDGLGKIEKDIYGKINEITGGVHCLTMDKNNIIWIGTERNGLYSYKESSFSNYNISNSDIPGNGIISISVDPNNNLWFPIGNGIVKYNHSDFKLFNLNLDGNYILCVAADKNDTIWCGTFNGDLLCFNDTGFSAIGLSNSPLKSNNVNDIIVNDSAVFIGTVNNLVVKASHDFFSMFEKSNDNFNSYIQALVSKANTETWITFGVGDTCLLKMSDDEITVFDSSNSPFYPNYTFFSDMVIDLNNNLWIATYNGLYKYLDGVFYEYSTSNSEIPSNTVFCLFSDNDNNLWGGTDKGLFNYNGISWKIWDRSNSNIPTNVVNCISGDSNNSIWFSCMDENRIVGGEYGGGITSFNGQKMQTYNTYNSELPANTIFDIYIDSDTIIWLGTCGEGLVRFDGNNYWNIYNVFNSGLSHNNITKITRKGDELWIGHSHGGISVANVENMDQDIRQMLEEKKIASISIFPNPTNNGVYVKIGDSTIIPNLFKLFDISGKLIYSKEIEYFEDSGLYFVPLSEVNIIQNGLYILHLYTNKAQYTERIIVMK